MVDALSPTPCALSIKMSSSRAQVYAWLVVTWPNTTGPSIRLAVEEQSIVIQAIKSSIN